MMTRELKSIGDVLGRRNAVVHSEAGTVYEGKEVRWRRGGSCVALYAVLSVSDRSPEGRCTIRRS